jgi:hypothetical protein
MHLEERLKMEVEEAPPRHFPGSVPDSKLVLARFDAFILCSIIFFIQGEDSTLPRVLPPPP